MTTENFYVYMLLCENNSYYTGFTTNLERRFAEHLQGSAKCKYTRSFKPLKIAQSWQLEDKNTALKMEKYIKSLSAIEKQKLIQNPESLNSYFQTQ